jgi:TetR/AcrR family tetracycline transcriptional repressor
MDTTASATGDGLTRQKVVRTALGLLDEVGLDGLTTRRLAAELKVKQPALYWHFRNKRELLDQMAEALLLAGGMGGPRDGESWQEWLTRRANTYRRVLLDHRDGGQLIAGSHPGAAVVRLFDEELSALVERGFTPQLALRGITAVVHYTTGSVLQEQAQRSAGDRPLPPSDEIPTLTAAMVAGGADPDVAFEQGLQLIIDGIATSMARLQP